ncbi:hypothetical protein MMIC_P0144 [Mariprofundus micogutta]|uniref:HupE / UreJ protein n=1 Tax=Mariprofundus micogutta TaxID=1921010 RepID=A0A1L8CK02_9PROT|nr:hypothetical protein [Mariprofundus micogutta]GAV19215.1 hypothetical protein MMIC_P0144 [Mariprofundus micogutta]
MFKLFVAIIITLIPSIALAHSGHGHIEAASIWHWLFEFDHIGWLVPIMIALIVSLRMGVLNRHK